jgi:hypothetical protein
MSIRFIGQVYAWEARDAFHAFGVSDRLERMKAAKRLAWREARDERLRQAAYVSPAADRRPPTAGLPQ